MRPGMCIIMDESGRTRQGHVPGKWKVLDARVKLSGYVYDMHTTCDDIAPTCNGLTVDPPDGTYISDGCDSERDQFGSVCTIKCLNGHSPNGPGSSGIIRCLGSSYSSTDFACSSMY